MRSLRQVFEESQPAEMLHALRAMEGTRTTEGSEVIKIQIETTDESEFFFFLEDLREN